MKNQTNAEITRNFYRLQGEEKERLRILSLLKDLEEEKPGAAWSPAYILKLVKNEA